MQLPRRPPLPWRHLISGDRGYDGLTIDNVEFDIVSTDRKSLATLDRITVDRNEVRPGDTLTLSALMRESNGQTFIERYSVLVPAGLPTGSVQLLVGDGTTSPVRNSSAMSPVSR
jgi:hypothetical protein